MKNDRLYDQIKLFLKLSGYKQLRYRPSLFPPKWVKNIGKMEIVSDGKSVWWEQASKRGDHRLDVQRFPKLYNLIPRYLDEFFKVAAEDIVKESKKNGKEKRTERTK